MKRWIWFFVIGLLIFAIGCAISDQQIKDISESVGAVTTTAVGVAVAAATGGALSPEAGGGLAAGAGAAMTLLVAWVLRSIRKTPTPPST